jgi:pilus assembly protein TadC
MPVLASIIASLFGGLATFFSAFLAKKAAFAVAAVATFAALTAGFVTAIQLLVAGLVVAFPSSNPIIVSLIWTVLPDNASVCIAACVSCDAAVAVYRWNAENVRLATQAG